MLSHFFFLIFSIFHINAHTNMHPCTPILKLYVSDKFQNDCPRQKWFLWIICRFSVMAMRSHKFEAVFYSEKCTRKPSYINAFLKIIPIFSWFLVHSMFKVMGSLMDVIFGCSFEENHNNTSFELFLQFEVCRCSSFSFLYFEP